MLSSMWIIEMKLIRRINVAESLLGRLVQSYYGDSNRSS